MYQSSKAIVTISIGGNNIGFAPLAKKCVESSDCTISTEYSYTRNKLDNDLASELDTLYYNMGLRIGPQTRVLVVGYPEMIPDPALNTIPFCPYLSQTEKAAARDVISDLNQTIQDEVAEEAFGSSTSTRTRQTRRSRAMSSASAVDTSTG